MHKIHDNYIKRIVLFIMMLAMLTAVAAVTVINIEAEAYYTVRVDYKYDDGTNAHDSYVAVFPSGENVDVTVTNPTIPGFKPVTAVEGGEDALTTSLCYSELKGNKTVTVYYVPDLVHYRVRYFFQNIRDDLYTENLGLSNDYYERFGYTGEYPTELEDLEFEGFTSLFHEPDFIAADGSTVFKMYYDRNYVLISFDLDGGYGVDPVYAKYGSTFNIAQPKRVGYTFRGWAQTNSSGEFIDDNGSVITEEAAAAALTDDSKFTSGTVPAEDAHYKAIWDPSETSYSVVYWLENADDDGYAVIAAKDVTGVESGSEITQNSKIKSASGKNVGITDFFSFNLNHADPDDPRNEIQPGDEGYEEWMDYTKYDSNGKVIDFPDISKGLSEDLVGNGDFYELNTAENTSDPEYVTDTSKTVEGDGTTRFNVFYKRVRFDLKFYYAREGLTNGAPNGKVSLTNSTKDFSKYDYKSKGESYISALAKGPWVNDIGDSLPQITAKYSDRLQTGYEDYNGYRYYYYQEEAKFDENLADKWFIDAVTNVSKKGNYDEREICKPGSWAVEFGTNYYYSHTKVNNFTIKGIYEKLGKELMFKNGAKNSDYNELHYLLSWTNTATTKGHWNYGIDRVLHFKYENYVELLPGELETLQTSGASALTEGDGAVYTDVMEFNGKWYGLTSANTIQTTDSGDQYDRDKTNAVKTANVRTQQTPAEITGFEIENYRLNDKGQIILDDSNTIVDWSEDTDYDRHATIKYFYRRRVFTLKFRNGNIKDNHRTRELYYDQPMDGNDIHGDPVYYTPDYYIPDLAGYYSFEGWYGDPYHSPSEKIPMTRGANFSSEARMPAEDDTLYAKWEPAAEEIRFYNDFKSYTRDSVLHSCRVHYNEFILTNDIPADDPSASLKLTKPSPKADFAGWYYINEDRKPVRFDPENMTVKTPLRLYAEWESTDTAKYRITYVEEGTGIEVAPPATGTNFVSKTKTFTAKSGSELNAAHAWSSGGANWWPTVSSHSVLIEPNDAGEEYAPNEYTFEYFKKPKVWYQVQYINAVTGRPMEVDDQGEAIVKIVESSNAVVTEKSKYHDGFIADRVTKSAVLAASTESNPVKAKAEELERNKIVFFYNINDNEALYQVDHYIQSLDNPDEYTLYLNETLAGVIGDTVQMSYLYNDEIARSLTTSGYEVNESKTTIDDAPAGESMVIDESLKTVKIYYDRDWYNYVVKYVDYEQARRHNNDSSLWDGVLETVFSSSPRPVGEEEEITVPTAYTYKTTDPDTGEEISYAYHRISDRQLSLTIRPDDLENPTVNVIEVFYKKDSQRLLRYRAVCTTQTDEEFALLTQSGELVETAEQIKGSAANSNPYYGGRYKFLGWFDNPDGTGDPLCTESKYVPSLPGADMTYYAVFEQVQVSMTVDIMYKAERNTKSKGRSISEDYLIDTDGSVTGSYIYFEDPHKYENGTDTAYDDTKMFDFSVKPIDDKIYKYEFSGWYEEDLTDGHIIEHLDITSNEVKEHMDKHYRYIAMFDKKAPETELNYEIRYVFNTRSNGTQSFVVKGVLSGEELESSTNEEDTAYELNNEFIMSRAPYESNYGERLYWSDEKIVKDSSDKEKTMYATVTAVQTAKKVTVNYRLTPDSPYTSVQTGFGANRENDEALAAIDVTGDVYDGKYFTYWDIRRTEDGPTVAKCYDPWFTYCMIDSCYITPVFATSAEDAKTVILNSSKLTTDSESEWLAWTWNTDEDGALISPDENLVFTGLKDNAVFMRVVPGTVTVDDDMSSVLDRTGELKVVNGRTYSLTGRGEDGLLTGTWCGVTLTHLEDNRNRWTDEDGNVASSGDTDLLYADFEIAFEDGEQLIHDSDSYRTGVVFELCAQLPADKTFDPDRDYGFVSDEAALKQAIIDNASKYNYKTGKSRNIQVCDIPTASLTNKNRVEFGKPYKNTYKESKGYTNSTYVMKATAYLIDSDNNVTLSNSVYICLSDIAAHDLAASYGEIN